MILICNFVDIANKVRIDRAELVQDKGSKLLPAKSSMVTSSLNSVTLLRCVFLLLAKLLCFAHEVSL